MADKMTYEELEQRVKELENQNFKLRESDRAIKAILEISSLMTLKGSFEEHLPQIMKYFSELIYAERTSLFILSGDHMRFMLMSRFAEGLENDISLDLHMGLVGASVLNGKIVNVSNAYDDLRFNPEVDKMTGHRTESALCIPFTDQNNKVTGAVELINKRTGIFTNNDEKIVLEKIPDIADMDFSNENGKEWASQIAKELTQIIDCEGCTIFKLNRQNGELSSVAAEGLGDNILKLNVNLGVAGIVALTGNEIVIEDAYEDERFNRSLDKKSGFRTKQILCVPLINHQDEIIAVIQLINKREGNFDDDDLNLVKKLSSFVAIYIENSILLKEYRQQFQSILEVMAASIDAKDPLTASHSKMVKEYSVGIAKELGFNGKDIDVLSVAAWLHDYGKLGIKEDVLTKAGKLSSEEYDHIKKHAANTRAILEKMFLAQRYKNVPLIASSHHERLDGKGYSNGLSEYEIPYFAKIIAVADVFDALTAKRHYRNALSAEKAFEILDQGIGTQFDDHIVSAMKRYWQKECA